MSALSPSRRAPVPAYCLGRFAEFWLTRLQSRRSRPASESPVSPSPRSCPQGT